LGGKALATAATHRRVDPRRMSELDETFHRTMFGPGAGARLLAIHETLQPQAYRYRRLFHYSASELTPQSVAEHDEIIAAIERGAAHQAMLAVHKNWNNGSARVGQAMARVGEFGGF
jgi:DNA-binding GntR family transcriptional regulator